MSQQSLFYESFNDAIRDVVRVSGGTKVVAARLWPEKAPDAAARMLSDCLNEHRAERLSPEQVMLLARIGKEHGCHAIIDYQCAELGYSKPVAIEPADELAELLREYLETRKREGKLEAKIERLRSVA